MYVLVDVPAPVAAALRRVAKRRGSSVAALSGVVLEQWLSGRLLRFDGFSNLLNGVGSADLRNEAIGHAAPAPNIAALSKGVNKSASKIVVVPCESVGKPEGAL